MRPTVALPLFARVFARIPKRFADLTRLVAYASIQDRRSAANCNLSLGDRDAELGASAEAKNSSLTTDFINPVIVATNSVFEMMLDDSPSRTRLSLIKTMTPGHEVSAIVEVTGKAQGIVVLSLSRPAALAVLQRLLGVKTTVIGPGVCDAVGELANMISGNAKSKLEELELSLSIPDVVFGKNRTIRYPKGVLPMRLAFDSGLGPFSVDFGFIDA